MSNFDIVIGDWSGDGHTRTERFTVFFFDHPSNEELWETYKANVAKIGFDPRDYCNDYEDSIIPKDFADALKESGFDVDAFSDEFPWAEPIEDDDGSLSIDTETYVLILMHYFTLGTDLRWSRLNPAVLFGSYETGSGGYGLFYS